MWKRTTKTPWGEVDHILTDSQCLTGKELVYDAIHPNRMGYNPENLDVTYEISYLTIPEEKWKGDCEPYDRYNLYVSDSLGNAVQEFCIRLFDDDVIDLKFFMQISRKGSEIAETYMDIPSALQWTLRGMVNQQINRRLSEKEITITELTEALELYQQFVKQIHGEKLFAEFREGKENG